MPFKTPKTKNFKLTFMYLFVNKIHMDNAGYKHNIVPAIIIKC